MREIKFRAWHKTENSMLKPDDKYGTTHDLDCVVYYMQGQPVELMQYTGLKDKNGREIYEGDIVKFKYSRQDKQGTIAYATCGFWIIGWLDILDRSYHYPIEVIGNIYENPELVSNYTDEVILEKELPGRE